jgi:hypothetical protein
MQASVFEQFPGLEVVDTSPVEVTNPFSGIKVILSPEEIAVYDYLRGCEMFGDVDGMRRGLDWFIVTNPTAYMALLD